MLAPHAQSRRRARRAAERRRDSLVLAGVILALSTLALLLLLAAFGGPSEVSGPARVGQAMPNFSLATLTGEQVHLRDYAGRPVLVNAWATWCPPCRAEMPALDAFYLAHRAEGFQLLAINAGEGRSSVAGSSPSKASAFRCCLTQERGFWMAWASAAFRPAS